MEFKYKNIKPISFKSGIPGAHLLISGGVHGDEYEPIVAIRRLIDDFKENKIEFSGKVTLLTIANEAAYRMGERTAADGKDLARTCPGKEIGTITEETAFEVSDLIRRSDFYIDMHTGGNLFEISPLAGYILHRDPDILSVQREMAKAFNLPIVWGTSPKLEGRSLSVARDAGVPAIYTEYGGGSACSEEIVKVLVRGCKRVMNYIRDSKPESLEGRTEFYHVEDYREDSGHLQILYPSPLDGILTYRKKPGNFVTKGEVFGSVHDPFSGEEEDLTAEEEGLIFMIRTRARVNKGDATIGILPVTGHGKKEIK